MEDTEFFSPSGMCFSIAKRRQALVRFYGHVCQQPNAVDLSGLAAKVQTLLILLQNDEKSRKH
ncbi:hypothetical protein [Thiolapillus sp.]